MPVLTWSMVTVYKDVDPTKGSHLYDGALHYRIEGVRSDGKVFVDRIELSALECECSPNQTELMRTFLRRAREHFERYLEAA